jgi:hypothetical protein
MIIPLVFLFMLAAPVLPHPYLAYFQGLFIIGPGLFYLFCESKREKIVDKFISFHMTYCLGIFHKLKEKYLNLIVIVCDCDMLFQI